MSAADPRDVRAIVDAVCAEMGLDEFVANTVEQWVGRPEETWGTCCLSDCDPCNSVIRRATKRVLARLEPEDQQ